MTHQLLQHCHRYGHLWEKEVCKRCNVVFDEEMEKLKDKLANTMTDLIKVNELLTKVEK